MTRVVTRRPHGNAYGPVFRPDADGELRQLPGSTYRKIAGDAYDYPAPEQLIADGVLALPEALDRDGDGEPGGSPAGAEASATIGRRRARKRAGPGTPSAS